MIGPVFGTQNSEIPCAIIQFINKIETNEKDSNKNIGEAEEIKFLQMQNLLGMCVENTNEMSTTINTSFNVQDVMKNIQEMMKQEKERSETSDTDAIIKELTDHLNVIKQLQTKLQVDRNKPF